MDIGFGKSLRSYSLLKSGPISSSRHLQNGDININLQFDYEFLCRSFFPSLNMSQATLTGFNFKVGLAMIFFELPHVTTKIKAFHHIGTKHHIRSSKPAANII